MSKPLVSIIVPVRNVDEYIAEAIDSIVNQSIGFTENVELILAVNDSTDESQRICEEYASKYPRNIAVLVLEKGGVSNARNVGLKKATGKYVQFFDADDLLSKDYLKLSYEFLEQNSSVDLVASKIQFFDEIIDSHPLNYKFSSDRVINLATEPDAPLLHITTAFVRRKALDGLSFDTNLTIAEDFKFVSDLLVKKKRYGVLKQPTYFYRKRTTSVSAIAGKERNKSYYLETPERVYEHALSSWKKSGNDLPIQYTLLYDLSYRLDQETQAVLNNAEQKEYIESIKNILISMSDQAILTTRFLSIHKKSYVLRAKYGDAFHDHITTKGTTAYFDDYRYYDYGSSVVHLDFLNKQPNGWYRVEGFIDAPVSDAKVRYGVDVSGNNSEIRFITRAQLQKKFLGETINPGASFLTDIEFPVSSHLSFAVDVEGSEQKLRIETGDFTRFGALKYTYRNDGDSLLKRTSHSINRLAPSKVTHILLEARMWGQILVNWRLHTAYDQLKKLLSRNLAQLSLKAKIFEILKPFLIIAESIVMIPRAFILRAAYYIALRKKERPIWIISDRGMAAGDNGEALFRYAMSLSRRSRPADIYFVISKKSKDYRRMKSIGPVLSQSSLRYKLKFLLADKIISSQADIEVTNPFIRQGAHYRDLFTYDFVFLQHGVIRHNLSTWLNRYNMNIKLFITSAEKEYNSIFNNPYYYETGNVLLSGMPRYDYLRNDPKRKLILAPTYRKNLAKEKTDKNGARRYDPTFKASEYRQFYNNFMNDPRLLSALQEAGMTGEFYLHPAFAAQHQDFDQNEIFTVMDFPYDYKTAFSEGEMMVSDHSSVVFDFAYLKKPVAYAHFDVKTFFAGHSYDESNFFSDEDDGFGGVYYDYDTLVGGVIDTIKAGCVMSDKYKKRVDNFFYKVDKNNSKRVYDAIVKV